MRKVGIIGSEEKYWTPETRKKVINEITKIFYTEYMKQKKTEITKEYGEEEFDNIKYVISMTYPKFNKSIILVSGGCPKDGVDIYAEIVADTLGIMKEIYKPEVNQWEDMVTRDKIEYPVYWKGYKSRNIQIAESCDILYCIDAKGRKKSGGRWTMDYAKKLGKEVHLIEVE